MVKCKLHIMLFVDNNKNVKFVQWLNIVLYVGICVMPRFKFDLIVFNLKLQCSGSTY